MSLDPTQRSHLVAVFRQLFDSSQANVCMIAYDGEILAVNEAWRAFGEENGLRSGYRCEGQNYIEICDRAARTGDTYARDALTGLLAVMNAGRPKVSMTYPCHAPHERRWFKLWIEPQIPEAAVIVVAHFVERVEAGAGILSY